MEPKLQTMRQLALVHVIIRSSCVQGQIICEGDAPRIFTARQHSYAERCISYSKSVRPSVCLSVCLSVRLSDAGTVSKTPATIMRSSLEDSPMTSFLMVDIGAKFQREPRERGRQMSEG